MDARELITFTPKSNSELCTFKESKFVGKMLVIYYCVKANEK